MLLRKTKKISSKVLREIDLSGLFDNRIIVNQLRYHRRAGLCLKNSSLRRICTSSRKDEYTRRIENGFAK